jgi:hypothetical protein
MLGQGDRDALALTAATLVHLMPKGRPSANEFSGCERRGKPVNISSLHKSHHAKVLWEGPSFTINPRCACELNCRAYVVQIPGNHAIISRQRPDSLGINTEYLQTGKIKSKSVILRLHIHHIAMVHFRSISIKTEQEIVW